VLVPVALVVRDPSSFENERDGVPLSDKVGVADADKWPSDALRDCDRTNEGVALGETLALAPSLPDADAGTNVFDWDAVVLLLPLRVRSIDEERRLRVGDLVIGSVAPVGVRWRDAVGDALPRDTVTDDEAAPVPVVDAGKESVPTVGDCVIVGVADAAAERDALLEPPVHESVRDAEGDTSPSVHDDDVVPEHDELCVVLMELEWDALVERGSGLAEGEVLFVMLGVRTVSVIVGEAEVVAVERCDALELSDAEGRGSEAVTDELSVTRRLTDAVRLLVVEKDELRDDVLRLSVKSDVSEGVLETEGDGDAVRVALRDAAVRVSVRDTEADCVRVRDDDNVPDCDGL
jgi:hypothetical protein